MVTIMNDKSSKKRPGGFNRGFANWIRSNASLFGERSNFDGVVGAIAKGGNQGNRGTKGVGKVRIEPFEDWADLSKLHEVFAGTVRYATAFRALTTWERWVLCARYLCRKESFPLGLDSALGDLGAVAAMAAYQLGVLEKFTRSAGKAEFERWQGIAEIVSEQAHEKLEEALADYDAENDRKAGSA